MQPVEYHGGRVRLYPGDCLESIKSLPDCSIDAVVTDPPYALVSIGKRFGSPDAAPSKVGVSGVYARASKGFMGKSWDNGERAFAVEFWAEIYRVLKPGGHVLAFSATRTVHRLTCAIEDAGFEIRDMIAWLYASGFPKSHDVAKGIDAKLGVERRVVGTETLASDMRGGALLDVAHGGDRPALVRDVTVATSPEAIQWQGWGTALKPAIEPITVARKPLAGTVAETVLAHGTGALNVDACRVEMSEEDQAAALAAMPAWNKAYPPGHSKGSLSLSGGADGSLHNRDRTAYDPSKGRWPANIAHDASGEVEAAFPVSGGSSAARFFFSAKAGDEDRIGSKHPTVKPVDLMRWLVRLVTPPGGTVLDPFAGSGTTGEAAFREGFNAILCERDPEYLPDIARRIELALAGPAIRRAERAKARAKTPKPAPLFGEP